MAEEQKQSKCIGELFVELKGLPTLLKELDKISADFLLGKNAANQFVKLLTQPAKEANNAAVQFGKKSDIAGVSLQEYMKLHLYLKSHNLNDGLLNNFGSVSDMLTRVQTGVGTISGGFAYVMHQLGFSCKDYDGGVDSILQITKEDQNLINSQEAIVNSDADPEPLRMHLLTKLNTNIQTGVTSIINNSTTSNPYSPTVAQIFNNWFKNQFTFDKMQEQFKGRTAPLFSPVTQGLSTIPPNLYNSNTTIQVSNENHINVANPQDVGTAISSISRETLQNIEYIEFQSINRPGL